MQLDLPASDYPAPADVGAFYSAALERIRSLPGVVSATAMSGLPDANDTEFEGVEQTEYGLRTTVDYWTAVDGDNGDPDPGGTGLRAGRCSQSRS